LPGENHWINHNLLGGESLCKSLIGRGQSIAQLLYHFDQFGCHASRPFFLTPDLIFLGFIQFFEIFQKCKFHNLDRIDQNDTVLNLWHINDCAITKVLEWKYSI